MWAYVNSCSVLLFLAGGLDWFEGLGLLLGFGFGVVCGAVLSFNMGFTVGPYRGADVLGFSEQNSSHGVFVFEMEWGVSCSGFFGTFLGTLSSMLSSSGFRSVEFAFGFSV